MFAGLQESSPFVSSMLAAQLRRVCEGRGGNHYIFFCLFVFIFFKKTPTGMKWVWCHTATAARARAGLSEEYSGMVRVIFPSLSLSVCVCVSGRHLTGWIPHLLQKSTISAPLTQKERERKRGRERGRKLHLCSALIGYVNKALFCVLSSLQFATVWLIKSSIKGLNWLIHPHLTSTSPSPPPPPPLWHPPTYTPKKKK